MCLMCDGWSVDEVNADLHDRIVRFGWTMIGVDDSPAGHAWTYTIGLAASTSAMTAEPSRAGRDAVVTQSSAVDAVRASGPAHPGRGRGRGAGRSRPP
jgi:hypothetical protein